jgi:DNA processing protein
MTTTLLSPAWSEHPLWARGNLDLVDRIPVAIHITGTRHPSRLGAEVSHSFATTLATAGHQVITGLSFGCEASIVRGFTNAAKPLIVALPCGLDHIYPTAHAALHDQVLAAGGLIVSTCGPDVTVSRTTIQQRAEWVATHSAGTLVIEAAARSSALYCADTAAAHLIPVASVPGPITSPTNTGSNGLLADGATPVVDQTTLLSWAEAATQPAARLALAGGAR